MEYIYHSILIALLLGLIIYDCVLFTNSVENFGHEYKLSGSAVGGVLAAIGTALPETVVPLVAILGAFFSGTEINVGEDIALGAVLGSPFLLSTIAFFVTGLSVIVCSKVKKRPCEMCSNPLILLRDLKFFVVSYSLAVGCAFVPLKPVKYVVAVFLIVYYMWYVKRTLRKNLGCECESNFADELIFAKIFGWGEKFKPFLIVFQIVFSLLFLILLAHFFVGEITYLATALNIPPIVMSLLLAPVATELPECFNSAIWIGQTKDSLSVSNITGALVFQSCIPAAIGISLTPWQFNHAAAVSVVLVYVSLAWVYFNAVKNKGMLNSRTLIVCGLFYLFYILYVLKMLI